MTEPLSIKDLNCYNCSKATLAHGKNWLHSGVSCEGKEVLPDGVATIEQKGCCYNPLALQVLAHPIVEELDKRSKEKSANYNPQYYRDEGRRDAYDEAVKLLNGGAP